MKITIKNKATNMTKTFSRTNQSITMIDVDGLEPVQRTINVNQLVGRGGASITYKHAGSRRIVLTLALQRGGADLAADINSILTVCQAGDPCLVTVIYDSPRTMASATATIEGIIQAPEFSQFSGAVRMTVTVECPASDFDVQDYFFNGRYPEIVEDYANQIIYARLPDATSGGVRVTYSAVKFTRAESEELFIGVTRSDHIPLNNRGASTVVFDCRPGMESVKTYLGTDVDSLTDPHDVTRFLDAGSTFFRLERGANSLLMSVALSPSGGSYYGAVRVYPKMMGIVDLGLD